MSPGGQEHNPEESHKGADDLESFQWLVGKQSLVDQNKKRSNKLQNRRNRCITQLHRLEVAELDGDDSEDGIQNQDAGGFGFPPNCQRPLFDDSRKSQ